MLLAVPVVRGYLQILEAAVLCPHLGDTPPSAGTCWDAAQPRKCLWVRRLCRIPREGPAGRCSGRGAALEQRARAAQASIGRMPYPLPFSPGNPGSLAAAPSSSVQLRPSESGARLPRD